MNFKKFVFYSFVGSVPWTLMLTYVGYWLGPNWEEIVGVFHGLDVLVVAAVIGIVIWYLVRLRNGRKDDKPAQP